MLCDLFRTDYQKGIRLIFRNQDVDILYGDVNELGDVGRNPGKSSLFFLTDYHSEIGLTGEGVQCRVKHCNFVVSGAFLTALENPRERIIFTPGRTHNRSRSPR
jgi:hypothetical protein